jgi:hypothetical protein
VLPCEPSASSIQYAIFASLTNWGITSRAYSNHELTLNSPGARDFRGQIQVQVQEISGQNYYSTIPEWSFELVPRDIAKIVSGTFGPSAIQPGMRL